MGGKIQGMGIEPTTSAVLKPRHNQLDHPCVAHERICLSLYQIKRHIEEAKPPQRPLRAPYLYETLSRETGISTVV